MLIQHEAFLVLTARSQKAHHSCKDRERSKNKTKQGSAEDSTRKEDSEPDSRKNTQIETQKTNSNKPKVYALIKFNCKTQAGIWVAATSVGTWPVEALKFVLLVWMFIFDSGLFFPSNSNKDNFQSLHWPMHPSTQCGCSNPDPNLSFA